MFEMTKQNGDVTTRAKMRGCVHDKLGCNNNK